MAGMNDSTATKTQEPSSDGYKDEMGQDAGNDGAAAAAFDPEKYVPKDRYSNLEKKLGEQGSELGMYRKQVDVLTNQLDKMIQQMGAAGASKKEQAAPKTDYDALRLDIAKKVESGDLSAEEGLAAISDWTAKFVDSRSKAEASDAMERAMAKMQEQLDGKFKELEAKKIQDQFLSENPDFQTLQQSGELEAIKSKNPMYDDVDAYFQHRAAKAESALAELQKKIENGARPTGPVMSRPGAGMRRTVDAGKIRTPAERDEAMNKAAERAFYGA